MRRTRITPTAIERIKRASLTIIPRNMLINLAISTAFWRSFLPTNAMPKRRKPKIKRGSKLKC
jgi:hypothetical protein